MLLCLAILSGSAVLPGQQATDKQDSTGKVQMSFSDVEQDPAKQDPVATQFDGEAAFEILKTICGSLKKAVEHHKG